MARRKNPDRLIALDKRIVDSIPAARAGKRDVYYVEGAPGLILLVTDKGTKTYYVQRRVNYEQRRILIGRADSFTPKTAREEAKKINARIDLGQDPEAEKRERRQRLREEKQLQDRGLRGTLRHYWEAVFEPDHVSGVRLRARTKEQYRTFWRRYIGPLLGDMQLSEIRRADVLGLQREVQRRAAARDCGTDGGRTANLAVAVLRIVLNHAIDNETIATANPCARVKPCREQKRTRSLDRETEWPRLDKALEDDAQGRCDWLYSDFFRVALGTGQRKSNLLSMRWDEVDLRARVWRIPPTKTKNGTVHEVPLFDDVVAILERRWAEAEQAHAEAALKAHERGRVTPVRCPWVFPARNGRGHLVQVRRPWLQILNRAGITDLRIHDLRHTLGTWLVQRGTPFPVVGAILGHLSSSTTNRYVHPGLNDTRAALSRTLGALDSREARIVVAENGLQEAV